MIELKVAVEICTYRIPYTKLRVSSDIVYYIVSSIPFSGSDPMSRRVPRRQCSLETGPKRSVPGARPEGTYESSPAIYRRVLIQYSARPAGTPEQDSVIHP